MFASQMFSLLPLAILIGILYGVALVVYRLYFSPISRFPGPPIAAATLWYQFYYDVVLGGQYVWKVREMHEKYGPIVRVNPFELHINDPAFADELWPGPGPHKRDKWEWANKGIGVPTATLITNNHDHHRLRRSALNPFFSKASIRKLQPLFDAKMDQFLERFMDFQRSGEVMVLNYAFCALTNDIACEFAFGVSNDRIRHPNFDPSFHDNCVAGLDLNHLMVHIPIIRITLEALPDSIASLTHPAYAMFLAEKRDVAAQAAKTIRSPKLADTEHRTIFHEIILSKLPPQEKTISRLGDEATTIVAAGTLTTAWTLSLAMYFLLTTPSILEKLKTELEIAIPDPSISPPLVTIENLPYLTAVIQEAIRLGHGASGRASTVAQDETMTYRSGGKEFIIPAGTPTSMSFMLLHHNESIFPDSKAFRPERWLENPRLDKYLYSFGKGTRQCVGINLAYAELFLTLSKIFRVYGSIGYRQPNDIGALELFETDYRDVECVADMYVPKMWKGTKGVRVRIVK